MPAYLMDDLIRWSGPIRERSLFLMPFDRRHSWVDPAEVGEAAANIIISRDDRHIGQYYDVECGHEVLRFGDVANMLSDVLRSEEHTFALQSLMRISYAVFCLKNNKKY